MTPAPSTISGSVRTTLLLAAAAALLTFALAPLGLPLLAWFGLVPWLVAVGEARSTGRAAWVGFIGGVLYFAMNIWWLWTASISGTALLVLYFSLYWALAAALIRTLGLLCGPSTDAANNTPVRANLGARLGLAGSVVAVAVVWTACEWLRRHVVPGFPWLPLAVTQTPLVVLCQSADFGGAAIVTFWLLLVNALLAAAWFRRTRLRELTPAAALVALALTLNAAYGAFRLSTTPLPGPTVLVVQSNFRHLRGGAPTRTDQQAVEFFLNELHARLAEQRADLALLPEAEFPPINDEARRELAPAPIGPFLQSTYDRLAAIAAEHNTSLLVGASAVTAWTSDGRARVGGAIHNSAIYFPANRPGEPARYDKLHLVPFSEQPPFAAGPAWLRRLGLAVAAARASQPLTPGDASAFKPFALSWSNADGSRGATTFIPPICLEAIDPIVVRRMMNPTGVARPRSAAGRGESSKTVHLIAVLSNDGWFVAQEKWQHLRSLAFRAIEHRAPLVRSSNTGVSGWIDSAGRIRQVIPPNAAGAATMTIELDARRTFYSRHGEVFAAACVALAALAAAAQLALRLK